MAVSLLASVTGVCAYLRHRRRRRGDFRVHILEYHDVSDGPEFEGTVSDRRFRRHLRHLAKRYPIVTLSQAAALLRGQEPLDRDVVVITFDDGYEGNFTNAWRVLSEEGLTAAIFVTTGFLDGEDLWFDYAGRGLRAAEALGSALPEETTGVLREVLGDWPFPDGAGRAVSRLKYTAPEERERVLAVLRAGVVVDQPPTRPLSWDHVRDLIAGGVEIGSHTVSHPILSGLSRAQQEAELRASRDRLAEETGTPPTLFAVPNGSHRDYDANTVAVLRELGYEAAVTTERGSNAPGCEMLTLLRIGVGADTVPVLDARLAGLFDEEVRRLLRGGGGSGG
jgi:peptidoglycan/xylan/chitin deacetylase (PgdA/CDA1 family)